jgi:hypothetical protein
VNNLSLEEAIKYILAGSKENTIASLVPRPLMITHSTGGRSGNETKQIPAVVFFSKMT